MGLRKLSLVIVLFWVSGAFAGAMKVDLGSAGTFAVLAGSTVTNTGNSVVNGNLGVWPGSAITGFPPGIVIGGTKHASDAVAMQGENDLTAAYNFAAAEACSGGGVLTGQDLGGKTLLPGVYCYSSSAQLTGILALDAQGDPNAIFLFQIGSTLTAAGNSSVLFLNGGKGGNLFWQVGSSATIGTNSEFAGNILALTSITLTNGANLSFGRALARNGAVTMDTNIVGPIDTAPEPGTLALLGSGFLGLILYRRVRRPSGPDKRPRPVFREGFSVSLPPSTTARARS